MSRGGRNWTSTTARRLPDTDPDAMRYPCTVGADALHAPYLPPSQ